MRLAVVGIDPGISGGVAVLEPGADSPLVHMCVMPIMAEDKGNLVDIVELAKLLSSVKKTYEKLVVIIERQQAFPTDSKAGAFKGGRNFGRLESVLILYKIPYRVILSTEWQKHRFKGMTAKDTKQNSVTAFKREWPSVSLLATPRCTKSHDGMSDAANIAAYGVHLVASGQLTVMPHG